MSFAAPVRYFFADQEPEAQSFAEEGGIAIHQAALGYAVWGRRRLLKEWALERGFKRAELQFPIVTGIWHILFVAGTPAAAAVAAEVGIVFDDLADPGPVPAQLLEE